MAGFNLKKFYKNVAVSYTNRQALGMAGELPEHLEEHGVSRAAGEELHGHLESHPEQGTIEEVHREVRTALERKKEGAISEEGLKKIVAEAITESKKGSAKEDIVAVVQEILKSEMQKQDLARAYAAGQQTQKPVSESLSDQKQQLVGARHITEIEMPLPSMGEGGIVRRKPIMGEEWRSIDLTQTNETYPIHFSGGKIHVYANIRYDPKIGSLIYRIIEPQLTAEERVQLDKIEETLVEELEVDFAALKRDTGEKYLQDKTTEVINYYRIDISPRSRELFDYYIKRDFLGLERVEPIFQDAQIEDISCDGVGVPIYIYHRDPRFGSIKTNVSFDSNEVLDSFVLRIAQRCGRSISVADPLLDGALPDGSRVQATFGAGISMKGSNFTLRKFTKEPLTFIDLIKYGTINSEMLAYLWLAIEHGKSILIAGPTASGKTTALNSLSLFIRPELKIVTIEDTPELRLPLENWVAQVARTGFGVEGVGGRKVGEITLFDLLRASLRQRPDMIIVGEVRGQEAYVLFQQMATGHPGLSTIHAESMEAVINRLRTPPIELPPSLIQHLDILLVLTRPRLRGNYVRRTKEIVEITGYNVEKDRPYTNLAYSWNPPKDLYEYSGRSAILRSIMEIIGTTPEGMTQEIERRIEVIEWMYHNGIRDYKNVGRVIAEYYQNPKGLLQRIGKI